MKKTRIITTIALAAAMLGAGVSTAPTANAEVVPSCSISTGADGKVKAADGTIIYERYIDSWGNQNRVGVATNVALEDVVLTVTYDSDETRKTDSWITPGWGAVDNSMRQDYIGKTEVPNGSTQSGSVPMFVANLPHEQVGNTLTVQVGDVPAHSSFSFNAGTGVVSAQYTGKRANCACTPAIPESNPVVGTFQVDRYIAKDATRARALPKLDDDGRLAYREDKLFWGASQWEFVTIYAKDVKMHGSLTKAINAKTKKVPNLTGLPRTTPRVGTSYTTAWKLHSKATTKDAWGTKKNLYQYLYTKVSVPAYRAPVPAKCEVS